MSTAPTLDEVKQELANLDAAVTAPMIFMKEVVRLLHNRMTKYNWVGFYMIENSRPASRSGAGPVSGSDDSAHAHPAESGDLWSGSLDRQDSHRGRCSSDPRYLACSHRNQIRNRGSYFCQRQSCG